MVTAEGTSTSTRNGKKHSDGSILLYFQDCGGQRQGLANSYSDIRVKTMGLHYPYDRVVGIEKEFDYFCNTLKEQRITCSHLHTYPEIKLTKEQCAELLDVLQPESVNIDNEGSDRYQAVFNIPTLKNVHLRLAPADAISATKEILPMFEAVNFQLMGTGNYSWDEFYTMFQAILQVVRFQPLPNLRNFSLYYIENKVMPPTKEILKKFRDFNPTLESKREQIDLKFKCLRDGSSCVVSINRCAAIITYLQDENANPFSEYTE